MLQFEPFWVEHFGRIPPLGFRLRTALPSRWLRIHSLDGAKRYAGDEVERAEVLSRANRAGDAVLCDGAQCWLVVPDYELEVTVALAETRFTPAMTAEVEDTPLTFHAAEVTWRAHAFDRLLHAIADDRGRALWVAIATAELFAPYDGGIDLVLASPERRDELRRDLARWISPRADGL